MEVGSVIISRLKEYWYRYMVNVVSNHVRLSRAV